MTKETLKSILEKRIKQIRGTIDEDFAKFLTKPSKLVGVHKWVAEDIATYGSNPSLTKKL